MKTFKCRCGNTLYFENTRCESCGCELGFVARDLSMVALTSETDNVWQGVSISGNFRKCQNYSHEQNCNWLVGADDASPFCDSCRLSEVIPDLSVPLNRDRWHRIERAKRRLLFSLYALDLPVTDRETDPEHGLAFHLMQDQQHFSEFVHLEDQPERVMTGHLDGVITLNIEEADPVLREENRTRLQEQYRTLLGHLRHESGHYYWDKLVASGPRLKAFRELFGDERADYKIALEKYYSEGPVEDWQQNWVSAYASAHPYEDWAECWAHYLHMIDTLETAYVHGSCFSGTGEVDQGQIVDRAYLSTVSIETLCQQWSKLSIALNEMNRSMGLRDAYPFVLNAPIVRKLSFIHDMITEQT